MEVKLIVASGKHAGQEVPVKGPKFLIGRAEDCQLRPGSDLVSRHHCAIIAEEGSVAVRDFDSSNGTYVNGERIKGERPLKTGDRLQVGQLEFEVQLVVEVGGKRKPKVHSVQEAAARTVESATASEDDLSRWLDDEEDEEEEARAGDTPIGRAEASDTKPIEATRADAAAAKEPAPQASEEEGKKEEQEEKEEKNPAKVVGAWQGGKKPDSASSGDAAADTLRNFFKRR